MSITKKDVEYVAKLARLGLSEKEKEKLAQELSGILAYMEKLNGVETKNVEATAQVTGLENIFRKDEKPHQTDVEKVKKIIGQAPEREGNFVKTKPILEK